MCNRRGGIYHFSTGVTSAFNSLDPQNISFPHADSENKFNSALELRIVNSNPTKALATIDHASLLSSKPTTKLEAISTSTLTKYVESFKNMWPKTKFTLFLINYNISP